MSLSKNLRYLLFVSATPLFALPGLHSCGGSLSGGTSELEDAEFSRLSREISEPGGYFWSNNYISNETSYQHVLEELDALPLTGQVYVGVGPNQNFTYIAAVRPEVAFIVDIRRQNLLEHLLFKVLMVASESREEYLSRLLGRPLETPLARTAGIEEIVAALRDAPPDERYFESEMTFVLDRLDGFAELELSPADIDDLRHIYREFFRLGLDIKYDSWRSFFFPSLDEFMLETDLKGRRRNWLATHEDYEYVRNMQRTNRIIPIVGDFAGDQALRRLGRFLESRDLTVSVFYLSNVEFYLFRQGRWNAFVENVKALPTSDSSVFIRAYANLRRPHPKMVDDHITVSLVQNIHVFLRNARAGMYNDLWDVVTDEGL